MNEILGILKIIASQFCKKKILPERFQLTIITLSALIDLGRKLYRECTKMIWGVGICGRGGGGGEGGGGVVHDATEKSMSSPLKT